MKKKQRKLIEEKLHSAIAGILSAEGRMISDKLKKTIKKFGKLIVKKAEKKNVKIVKKKTKSKNIGKAKTAGKHKSKKLKVKFKNIKNSLRTNKNP